MTHNAPIDPQLKTWATARQAELIDAVIEHGGIRAAARGLGVSYSTVMQAINAARARAALQGYSPAHDMSKTVPEPFVVKGVSTYYDKDGKPRGQWVKSMLDRAQMERVVREAVQALAEDVPRLKPRPPPKLVEDALCTVYTLTDCHVGMRAWAPETGADWDLKIAESTLVGAVDCMVASAQSARTAVVAQLGDWLHFDSLAPITPTNAHPLDADSRYSKVVQAAVRILRRIVLLALAKHSEVIVIVAEGNHDMAGSVWMRHLFALLFENEPRARVIDSELPYYVHQHGEVMLGWHHGHLKRPDQLPLLFAAQFPQVWGSTKRRYIHVGHMHHVHEKEHNGVTVIQHPTIAARDAYAARSGWVSDRQMTAITYHCRFGQVARSTVVPEMLEPA